MMPELKNLITEKVPWLDLFRNGFEKPSDLPRVLENWGLRVEVLKKLAVASHTTEEPYGRKILFQNPQIEVMLACWLDHGFALPHNHGSARGMIWFVEGNFIEQHFRFQNGSLISLGDPETHLQGAVAVVDPSHIHSCQPQSTGLSLHIYSPPIRQMKVWDRQGRRTLTVTDNCGAWIPKDSRLIVNVTPWATPVENG